MSFKMEKKERGSFVVVATMSQSGQGNRHLYEWGGASRTSKQGGA